MAGDSTKVYAAAKPFSYIANTSGFRYNEQLTLGLGAEWEENNWFANIEGNIGDSFANAKGAVGASIPLNDKLSLDINTNGYCTTGFTENHTVKAGIGTDIKYSKNFFNASLGLEGGYAKFSPITESTPFSLEQQKTKSAHYITPTFKGEMSLGNKWALTANANLFEGGIGVKYYLK